MRLQGKLHKWNNEKAFGFITPNSGGDNVFIHKTAFENRRRTPKTNDVITFSIAKDQQGRYCAANAIYLGEKPIKKQTKGISKFSIYLSVTFLGLLMVALLLNSIPQTLALAYLALSVLTYMIYALDKSKAQRGAWRISETSLHFLALIGGWPGGAIAQQLLRHKSKKRSFRLVFLLTVIINCITLAWLTSASGEPLLRMLK
jgi:uncharacterized membrane protein YsdA (DUF1294 family)/cold shock CspA family protein